MSEQYLDFTLKLLCCFLSHFSMLEDALDDEAKEAESLDEPEDSSIQVVRPPYDYFSCFIWIYSIYLLAKKEVEGNNRRSSFITNACEFRALLIGISRWSYSNYFVYFGWILYPRNLFEQVFLFFIFKILL